MKAKIGFLLSAIISALFIATSMATFWIRYGNDRVWPSLFVEVWFLPLVFFTGYLCLEAYDRYLKVRILDAKMVNAIKVIAKGYKIWAVVVLIWEVIVFLPVVLADADVDWADVLTFPTSTLILPYLLPKIFGFWQEKTPETKHKVFRAIANVLIAIAIGMIIRDFVKLFFIEEPWQLYNFNRATTQALKGALGTWTVFLALFLLSERKKQIAIAIIAGTILIALLISLQYIQSTAIDPNPEAEYTFEWGFRNKWQLFAVVKGFVRYDEEANESIYSPWTVIRLEEDEVNFDCKKWGLWALCNSKDYLIMDFHNSFMSRSGIFSEGGRYYSSPADLGSMGSYDYLAYRLYSKRLKELEKQGVIIIQDKIYMPYDAARCWLKSLFIQKDDWILICTR